MNSLREILRRMFMWVLSALGEVTFGVASHAREHRPPASPLGGGRGAVGEAGCARACDGYSAEEQFTGLPHVALWSGPWTLPTALSGALGEAAGTLPALRDVAVLGPERVCAVDIRQEA